MSYIIPESHSTSVRNQVEQTTAEMNEGVTPEDQAHWNDLTRDTQDSTAEARSQNDSAGAQGKQAGEPSPEEVEKEVRELMNRNIAQSTMKTVEETIAKLKEDANS